MGRSQSEGALPAVATLQQRLRSAVPLKAKAALRYSWPAQKIASLRHTGTLEQVLTAQRRTRWLDVGSGASFDPRFHSMDILPAAPGSGERYTRGNIVELSERIKRALGQWDLVRLQHVLEHLTFEEGLRAIQNCGEILTSGGHLLLTTPDLELHAQRYLARSYSNYRGYAAWAQERIPADAPDSAYFSIFAHSLLQEPHKWCYDFEGLSYQVARSGQFTEIVRLRLGDQLASQPFTHNRPEEDVCLLATKK